MRRAIVFEPTTLAQSGYYIKYIAENWRDFGGDAELWIVVGSDFQSAFPDVVDNVNRQESNVGMIVIQEKDYLAVGTRSSLFVRGISRLPIVSRHIGLRVRRSERWRILRKYVTDLAPDHCLLLNFDSLALALALDSPLPCSVSGIYFKPHIHYPAAFGARLSGKERLRAVLELALLKMALRSRRVAHLFCLDPFATEYLNAALGESKIYHLPEPARIVAARPEAIARLRDDLKIEPGRTVFLMFGAIARRKGIFELLEAMTLVPKHISKRMCLLLVGPVREGDRLQLQGKLRRALKDSQIQIVERADYVQEPDIMPYFAISDVVLVLNVKHVGSSGVLLHAAAAGKPVLASDYGLVGALTRRHRLGLTVDSASPPAIAEGLAEALSRQSISDFDRESALRFARENSPANYARTIIATLANDGGGFDG